MRSSSGRLTEQRDGTLRDAVARGVKLETSPRTTEPFEMGVAGVATKATR